MEFQGRFSEFQGLSALRRFLGNSRVSKAFLGFSKIQRGFQRVLDVFRVFHGVPWDIKAISGVFRGVSGDV